MLCRVTASGGAYVRTYPGQPVEALFDYGTIVNWEFEEPPSKRTFHELRGRELVGAVPDPRSLSPDTQERQDVEEEELATSSQGVTGTNRGALIMKACEELDPLNVEHWTPGQGLPMTDAVAELSGLEGVTRDEIKAYMPGFVRP